MCVCLHTKTSTYNCIITHYLTEYIESTIYSAAHTVHTVHLNVRAHVRTIKGSFSSEIKIFQNLCSYCCQRIFHHRHILINYIKTVRINCVIEVKKKKKKKRKEIGNQVRKAVKKEKKEREIEKRSDEKGDRNWKGQKKRQMEERRGIRKRNKRNSQNDSKLKCQLNEIEKHSIP